MIGPCALEASDTTATLPEIHAPIKDLSAVKRPSAISYLPALGLFQIPCTTDELSTIERRSSFDSIRLHGTNCVPLDPAVEIKTCSLPPRTVSYKVASHCIGGCNGAALP
jgi:hypothetical protein